MNFSKYIQEITKNIFYIKCNNNKNIYVVHFEEFAIIIDPGSKNDFEIVYKCLKEVVGIEKIKFIVLNQFDPHFYESIFLFEEKGLDIKIIAHNELKSDLRMFGINLEIYTFTNRNLSYKFKNDVIFKFIPSIYVNGYYSTMIYYESENILFSGNLFNNIPSKDNSELSNGMFEYYQNILPSNEISRIIMDTLIGYEIKYIAPKYGIILDNTNNYFEKMKNLECGKSLTFLKRELFKKQGYLNICNLLIRKLIDLFGLKTVLEIFNSPDIVIDANTGKISFYTQSENLLWNLIFEKITIKKGLEWLLIIDPYVRELSREYDITIPSVFNEKIKKLEEKATILSNEIIELRELNQKLDDELKKTREKNVKCPVTNLYLYKYFKQFIERELKTKNFNDPTRSTAILGLNLDDIANIRFDYGDDEVDEILKNTSYILNSLREDKIIIFRHQGAAFICLLPNYTHEESLKFADEIRQAISKSEKYIKNITVSIGIVHTDEIDKEIDFIDRPFESINQLVMKRVKIARNKGKNIVCNASDISITKSSIGKILIADNDEIIIGIIKNSLENLNYEVLIARDGEETLKIAESEIPDLIVTEIMLKKKDAYRVNEILKLKSYTKDIPFIFMSYLKDESSVKRAISLGVEIYLKKPIMICELIGIIQVKIGI